LRTEATAYKEDYAYVVRLGTLTAPQHVADKLIQERVRALEVAGSLHVRVHNNGLDRVLVEGRLFHGPIVDLDVSKSVVRKRRLPCLCAVTRQDQVVGLCS
jgi:hypothetical protein